MHRKARVEKCNRGDVMKKSMIHDESKCKKRGMKKINV
jgi:hypothetical protein